MNIAKEIVKNLDINKSTLASIELSLMDNGFKMEDCDTNEDDGGTILSGSLYFTDGKENILITLVRRTIGSGPIDVIDDIKVIEDNPPTEKGQQFHIYSNQLFELLMKGKVEIDHTIPPMMITTNVNDIWPKIDKFIEDGGVVE